MQMFSSPKIFEFGFKYKINVASRKFQALNTQEDIAKRMNFSEIIPLIYAFETQEVGLFSSIWVLYLA